MGVNGGAWGLIHRACEGAITTVAQLQAPPSYANGLRGSMGEYMLLVQPDLISLRLRLLPSLLLLPRPPQM